jgi:hypothetical protein
LATAMIILFSDVNNHYMNKLYKIAGLLITCHLTISLAFIFFPSFLNSTLLAKIYNHYLLPGPFFSETRISESNYLILSWKIDNQWTTPINPSLNNFENYFSSINPTLLYRSRFERALYQQWVAYKSKPEDEKLGFLDNLKRYYKDTYVPMNSDSIKIIIMRKRTNDFMIEKDTLQQIKY